MVENSTSLFHCDAAMDAQWSSLLRVRPGRSNKGTEPPNFRQD